MSDALPLDERRRRLQRELSAFVAAEVQPCAGRWDAEQQVPPALMRRLAEAGWLAALLPSAWGGAGLDWVSYGLVHRALGRACSSLRAMLTVHDMVAAVILRFGSEAQKRAYLPRLARGELLAAFALTEPNIGSDARHVETRIEPQAGGYLLTGAKRWITSGQIAGLLLVVGSSQGQPTALLVEAPRPGLVVEPIREMLGMRGAHLAALRFERCAVEDTSLLAEVGLGFSHVTATALDLGRYAVACGCLGMAEACLDASLAHAAGRTQFGAPLEKHQLVRRLVARMQCGVRVAELLCRRAGELHDEGDPAAILETVLAKYQGAELAAEVASDAVQIHGALGCSGALFVERFFRDARIMTIIEGSSQMLELVISEHAFAEQRVRARLGVSGETT